MQNPFTQLKYYKPDLNNPKENHATECLAACLQFSDEIRASFVAFLFAGMKTKPPSTEEMTVQTQQMAGDLGIPDLVLEEEGVCRIAIEVKVEARLTKEQAKKYGKWLLEAKESERFLFSLEKEKIVDFDIAKESGVLGARRMWHELHAWFATHEKEFEPTAAKLIAHLRLYLEDEAIVTTWTPPQILALGRAVKAEKALAHCFARVADKLKKANAAILTETKPLSSQWPRLQVGLPDWQKLFGPGYQARVWAYFTVEDVWDSEASDFYFCFFLWNENFPSDWTRVRKKLPSWGSSLEAQGFEIVTNAGRGRKIPGAKRLLELTEAPKNVEVWFEDEKRSYISEKQVGQMNADDLVDEIVRRLQELCEVVSKLK